MRRFPVARDIVERVLSTFATAVVAAWVSAGADWQSAFQPDQARTYVGAGVLAVLTLVKGFIATLVARRGGQAVSASFDPAVKLQPVGASPSAGSVVD